MANGFELLESHYVFAARGTDLVLQQVRRMEALIDRSTRPVRQVTVGLDTRRAVQNARVLENELNTVIRTTQRVEDEFRDTDQAIAASVRQATRLERELNQAAVASRRIRPFVGGGGVPGGGGGTTFVPANAGRSNTQLALLATRYLSAAAAFETLRRSLGNAAEFQRTEASFGALLQSADLAEQTLRRLADFAERSPASFSQITESARLLLAFGSTTESLTTELQMLGDISSAIAAPINEIASIYGKIRVQGRVFAEDINQLQERGIPIVEQLAAKFGVATEEIRKMVEQGTVRFVDVQQGLRALTEDGGRFAGQMEAQAATMAGALSNALDSAERLSVTFGNFLDDVFQVGDGMRVTAELMGYLREGFEQISAAVSSIRGGLDGVNGQVEGLITPLQALQAGLTPLYSYVLIMRQFKAEFAEIPQTVLDEANAYKDAAQAAADAARIAEAEMAKLNKRADDLRGKLRTPFEESIVYLTEFRDISQQIEFSDEYARAQAKVVTDLEKSLNVTKGLKTESLSFGETLEAAWANAIPVIQQYQDLVSRGLLDGSGFSSFMNEVKQQIEEATASARELQRVAGPGSLLQRGSAAEFNFRIEETEAQKETLRLQREDAVRQRAHEEKFNQMVGELILTREAINSLTFNIPVSNLGG